MQSNQGSSREYFTYKTRKRKRHYQGIGEDSEARSRAEWRHAEWNCLGDHYPKGICREGKGREGKGREGKGREADRTGGRMGRKMEKDDVVVMEGRKRRKSRKIPERKQRRMRKGCWRKDTCGKRSYWLPWKEREIGRKWLGGGRVSGKGHQGRIYAQARRTSTKQQLTTKTKEKEQRRKKKEINCWEWMLANSAEK